MLKKYPEIFITILIGLIIVMVVIFVYFEKLKKSNNINQNNLAVLNTNATSTITQPEEAKEVIDESKFDMSGWKTYKNKYGFEIKYLPGWIIFDSTPGVTPRLLAEIEIKPKEISYDPELLLQVSVKKGSIDSLRQDIKERRTTIQKLIEISFNNKKAYEGVIGPNIKDGKVYYFENQGKLYTINFWPDNNTRYGITEEQALAALSSFKITE